MFYARVGDPRMKILHIAAHLGGGIGKAHAAMASYFPADIEQTFALLEIPIDRRHTDAIKAAGGRIVAASRHMAYELACDADIVQIEYWGHPALEGWSPPYGVPAVCWCHVSGLHPPLLPTFKFDRFITTSPITLPVLPAWARPRAQVINSGFGFDSVDRKYRTTASSRKDTTIVYLGTVDFKKMHPEFFTATDALALRPIDVWGHISRDAEKAHSAMRHPEMVRLHGHTLEPRAALSRGDIFFYPLARNHYGTGESALIEAMSLGLVPVVLDNPAEMSIVTHSKTGFVAADIGAAIEAVNALARQPDLRVELSRNAMAEVARTKSPRKSAAQFVDVWRGMLDEKYGCYGRLAYA